MTCEAPGMTWGDWAIRLLNATPAPIARLFRSDRWITARLRPWLNRSLPDGPRWARIRSGPARGIELLLDPRSEKFLWSGMHEAKVQEVTARFLQPGMCFWDVGAHVGYYALMASRRVGPSGRVIAFEPHPANRDRLRRAIERNALANVDVLPYAISDVAGTGRLFAGSASATWSLSGRDGDSCVEVPCLRLEDAAREAPAPSMIKIDVEGHETAILASSSSWLSRERPPLLVEFSAPADRIEAERMLPGYRFERLDDRHDLLRPEP